MANCKYCGRRATRDRICKGCIDGRKTEARAIADYALQVLSRHMLHRDAVAIAVQVERTALSQLKDYYDL